MVLRYLSWDREYGNSLVTGLLKHISTVMHRLEKQELLKQVFLSRYSHSCLRKGKFERV
jgi:hypothetical protein